MLATKQSQSENAVKAKNNAPFFPGHLVQPKLQINESGDSYEQEADAMADQVMRMSIPPSNESSFFKPAQPVIQRKCQHCEEEKLHRKESSNAEVYGGNSLDNYVGSLGTSGHALPESSRQFFEPRFGQDFSNVRIHTDSVAAKSAQSINALAYTAGKNIVFNSGQYSSESDSGKRLMAHELTHVVQQCGSTSSTGIQRKEDDTKTQPPKTPTTKRLRFDVLGSDYPVNKNFALAAKLEPGIDLHITSLDDLIAQLSTYVGGENGTCVSEINFWNHGNPMGQIIAGSETIETRGRKKYKIPEQTLSLSWLLNEKNQSSLKRLRALLCCDTQMRWLGCGTSGVIAEGGLRGKNEKANPDGNHYDLRYGKDFGKIYQTVEDAIAHGAKIEGAQLGFLNVQNWANATCANISANNDFTYMGPNIQGPHYIAGFGGEFTNFHPDTAHCSCDAETGRLNGDWTVKDGKKFLLQEEGKILGADQKWSRGLKELKRLGALNKSITNDKDKSLTDKVTEQSTILMVEQVKSLLPLIAIPAGLPVKEFIPWPNANLNTTVWAAATIPKLAFCYPDNIWRWIAINQNVLKTTPAYTKAAIEHELLHAKDIWDSMQKFIAINGQPPANPNPAGCTPNDNISEWDKDFGNYVTRFVAFYNTGKHTDPTSHIDIYAETIGNNIAGMSYEEIIAQFGAMLTETPPVLPATTRLKAEDVFEPYFKNPVKGQEVLREKLAEALVGTTRYFFKDFIGQAETLLLHFRPMWTLPYPMKERPALIKLLRDLKSVP